MASKEGCRESNVVDEMSVTIKVRSKEVLSNLDSAKRKALEMCGLLAEGYAKLECPVDTGRLRNSITHTSNFGRMMVGTNVEYAPYIEMGTGKHYKGGRRTKWRYQREDGTWVTTEGNEKHEYIKPSIANHKQEYIKVLKDELGRK